MSEYTLDEARIELARQECSSYGHDFDVVVLMGTGDPGHLLCRRCGQAWITPKRLSEEAMKRIQAPWLEDPAYTELRHSECRRDILGLLGHIAALESPA